MKYVTLAVALALSLFVSACSVADAVCYQDKVGALCASDYKFPQQQQVDEDKAVVERQVFGNNGHGRYNEKPATLKASGGDYRRHEMYYRKLIAEQLGAGYSLVKVYNAFENGELRIIAKDAQDYEHRYILVDGKLTEKP
jgi:hypothetical protein